MLLIILKINLTKCNAVNFIGVLKSIISQLIHLISLEGRELERQLDVSTILSNFLKKTARVSWERQMSSIK
jgi:hypothetical protein